MLKVTEQNDKLKREIIISAVLHVILYAVLVWSSFDEHVDVSAGRVDSSSITAVMMDLDGMVKNYNRQQQQVSAKRAEDQHEEKQVQEAEKKLAEKQKYVEKTDKKAQRQQKLTKEAAPKAVVYTKAKADVIKKVEVAKKMAQGAEKKAAISDINDSFSDLISDKSRPKIDGRVQVNNISPIERDQVRNGGASEDDINNYVGQIKSAIESRFYDASFYSGKTCTLRIKLAPDGLLLDIKSEGGDPGLCNAAFAAARQAKMPRPPSQEVYEVFKNTPLDFKP